MREAGYRFGFGIVVRFEGIASHLFKTGYEARDLILTAKGSIVVHMQPLRNRRVNTCSSSILKLPRRVL